MVTAKSAKEPGLSRPETLLRELIRDYPQAPAAADRFRKELTEPDGMRWPEWCFVPMSAWNAVVMEFGVFPGRSAVDLHIDMSRLHHLMGWRYTKSIYRFDPDLYTLLVSSPPEGNVPAAVLKRLPEWTLYIETPGGTPQLPDLQGFFVALEYEIAERDSSYPEELRLLLDFGPHSALTPLAIALGDFSVAEAIAVYLNENGAGQEINTHMGKVLAGQVLPLISLVLWICSDAPEVDSDRVPGSSPSRPVPKKTRRGWRLFPADHESYWTVGRVTGSQLRRAAESHATGDPTGRHVKTHLRRGHWHGYWQGSRKDLSERRLFYRFLSPILVNPQQ